MDAEIRIQIIYYQLAVQDLRTKCTPTFKKKSGDLTFYNPFCLIPQRLVIERQDLTFSLAAEHVRNLPKTINHFSM